MGWNRTGLVQPFISWNLIWDYGGFNTDMVACVCLLFCGWNTNPISPIICAAFKDPQNELVDPVYRYPKRYRWLHLREEYNGKPTDLPCGDKSNISRLSLNISKNTSIIDHVFFDLLAVLMWGISSHYMFVDGQAEVPNNLQGSAQ